MAGGDAAFWGKSCLHIHNLNLIVLRLSPQNHCRTSYIEELSKSIVLRTKPQDNVTVPAGVNTLEDQQLEI
jgi:hypothetical protein